MNKKTIVNLKKSQIVVMEGKDYDIKIEMDVDYYPFQSIAMIMKKGMADDKFRVDGILWGLWGDNDLTEQDCIDMKCCFDYDEGDGISEYGKKVFSILFFDGSFLDVYLSKNEFDFIIDIVREQLRKIKASKDEFSPLEGKLPMKRSMDNDEVEMVIKERRSRLTKKSIKLLSFGFLTVLIACAILFFLNESIISSNQKYLSFFIITFFYILYVCSLDFKNTPLRDVENEFVKNKRTKNQL